MTVYPNTERHQCLPESGRQEDGKITSVCKGCSSPDFIFIGDFAVLWGQRQQEPESNASVS